ncbi:MAG TPA: ABC-F family ATP-binding cassette domain-containing protein [Jiangellaceae bacterium]
MTQLSARSITHAYHGRTILDGVDVAAGAGERLGLVGQNGAGKSTLLRILAGRERPDGGSVARHGDIGYLAQQPELPDGGTIGEAVDAALARFRRLEARMRDLEGRMARGQDVLTEYGEVLAEYEDHDGWSADARAAKALGGLGLGDLPPERPVATLSGGQRARLALALVLVRAPEILLLDEPTNHLDDDALAYLEGALREHRGVLVAASHDRAFLDAVCTAILDLDPSLTVATDGIPTVGPSRYTGAYSEYLTGKAAARARWEQAYAAWTEEVNTLQAAVKHTARQVGHASRAPRDNDKFAPHFFAQRSDAAVARRVRDAENRLQRVREQRVPKPPKPLAFSAALSSGVPPGMLISARDIHVPGRVTIAALDVSADTRLLVTGPNGAGKSSLLAVLAGALAPARGRVMHARGLRIGWLPQEGVFPDPAATALHVFAAGRTGVPEDHQADLVGLGLLPPRDVHTPVGRLSVGQQRRLALARLLTSSPHVLLLDEPTNHLSLILVEELEAAVLGSSLPVVAVSHDRWLRRRWTGDELRLT